jgi:protein SCO1/2
VTAAQAPHANHDMPTVSTMQATRGALASAALATLAWLGGSVDAAAQDPARATRDTRFDQKLDAQVPLQARFKDESGRELELGELFGRSERPVVLTMVYYECPMLCTQVLNGFVKTLRVLGMEVGKDFDIVTVSIDPTETSGLAAAKKETYIAGLEGGKVADGWRWLVGSQASIDALADSVGFRYWYDAEIDEYAHPGGIVVLTPEGRVSRYFFDVEFAMRDLRLALVEASAGKIGSLTDKVMLLCYHYDPKTGKYGFVVTNVVRGLGGLTVLLLAGFVILQLRRDRRSAGAAA